MAIQSPMSYQSVALLTFGFVVLTLGGCRINLEQDPAETVTIVITGTLDTDDREEVQETLIGMTDGSSHMMTSSYSGSEMTITLSPVRDVEAFSRKINFGEVTEVDGRTVRVEFVE